MEPSSSTRVVVNPDRRSRRTEQWQEAGGYKRHLVHERLPNGETVEGQELIGPDGQRSGVSISTAPPAKRRKVHVPLLNPDSLPGQPITTVDTEVELDLTGSVLPAAPDEAR